MSITLLLRMSGTFSLKVNPRIATRDFFSGVEVKDWNDIGYQGWATVELSGGDAVYLKDVSARFDRFLAGEKPVAAGA